MKPILAVLLLAAAARAQDSFIVRLQQPAEVIAQMDLSSPGSDWARQGSEAAVADLRLDGIVQQQIMLYAGAARHTYSVFLGKLDAGEHRLQIARNSRFSAKNSGLAIHGAKFREVRPGDPFYLVLSHAPVLYARENTVGKFSDVPMVLYCERLSENDKPLLQYTVIFSNEDGGTSTRALMARWGRTTDVEYIYRGFIEVGGEMPHARIQTKNHKEIDFDGRYFGTHPILAPVTDNNMVAANVESAIRYQIAPVEADLTHATRESVMDSRPVTWTVMEKELVRERKLRASGAVDGQKISDPRNYLYMDVRSTLRDATLDFLVRVRGEQKWHSSSIGRPDYEIARNGWVRTTIELAPGTKLDQIEEFGFACHTAIASRPAEQATAGECRVEEINYVFLLDESGRPGTKKALKGGFDIPSGITWTLPSK